MSSAEEVSAPQRPPNDVLSRPPLVERFRQIWTALPKLGPVVLLLSGGGDSTALFRLLLDIEMDFACLYFWHDSPGTFADQSRAFCETLCTRHGVRLEVVSLAVASLQREGDLSWEAAARSLRYAELRRRPGHVFLTAHSADDQAETLLMRLLDGAGLAGLAGIRAVREDGVMRPLLDVARHELRDYLRESEQEWLEDPTNTDGNRRARLRHGLLATLCQDRPSLLAALGRTARSLAADEEALTQMACQWLELHRSGEDHWPLDELRGLHPAVRYRVFRQLWRLTAGASRRPLGGVFRECERLVREAHDDRYVEFWGRIRLRRIGGRLWLEPPLAPAFWSLTLGGLSPSHRSAPFWAFLTNEERGVSSISEREDGLIVRLPAGVFEPGEQYQLRSRRPGDRFEGKEVKKLLAATGHPPWVRDRWPLLLRAQVVVAIPGVGSSCVGDEVRLLFWPGRLRWPAAAVWNPAERRMKL